MEILPDWIMNNLRKFNNCLVSETTIKRHGVTRIIKTLEDIGFKGVSIVNVNDSSIIYVDHIDRKIDG